MKFNQLITFAAASVLLVFGASTTVAAPDNKGAVVEQKSVVQTTPEALYFDDMVPGIPQDQTLTVTNISGNKIIVTPSMDISTDYADLIDNDMSICETAGAETHCVPVTKDTRVELEDGQSEEFTVTLTLMQNLPDGATNMQLKGAIKITGEMIAGNEIVTIIPEGEKVPDNLAYTGLPGGWMTVAVIGALVLIVGIVLLFLAKRKNENEDVTETVETV